MSNKKFETKSNIKGTNIFLKNNAPNQYKEIPKFKYKVELSKSTCAENISSEYLILYLIMALKKLKPIIEYKIISKLLEKSLSKYHHHNMNAMVAKDILVYDRYSQMSSDEMYDEVIIKLKQLSSTDFSFLKKDIESLSNLVN